MSPGGPFGARPFSQSRLSTFARLHRMELDLVKTNRCQFSLFLNRELATSVKAYRRSQQRGRRIQHTCLEFLQEKADEYADLGCDESDEDES